jgi:switch-associated protein 70
VRVVAALWLSRQSPLLQVLTANIGTLLELYGVEKGLEHYRSTPNINFDHFLYYLTKEVNKKVSFTK